MSPLDSNDFLVLGFYIITTMMQLYFLWKISASLRTLVQNKREKEGSHCPIMQGEKIGSGAKY